MFARVGTRQTGIDRVEAKYLERFLEEPEPLFSLVRTVNGLGSMKRPAFSLLDRDATRALAERLLGATPWGRADLRASLRRKALPEKRAAYADLRRLERMRSGMRDLGKMLRQQLPEGTVWVNTGLTNLANEPVFKAIKSIPGGRVSILLHDVIPLDYPAYINNKMSGGFIGMMRHTSKHADLMIYNSDYTRRTAERHLAIMGRVPPMVMAHLGVEMPEPEPDSLPRTLDTSRPYFVILGTIEPRKNHALLLDIWEHFANTLPADEIPNLVIAGKRGWLNREVFERLDTSPIMGRHVQEFAGLDDGAVAALMKGAQALLMPSFVEGFGLPPAEALLLGTPALVNDLPVYREVLGNNPIYASVDDMYSWAEIILDLARADRQEKEAAALAAIRLPTWEDHFNLVLKVT
ncbi:hypothetical protein GCM10011358_03930 [Sinisalibacter lacisalsi]|uniref:Glycosyl transferase family 1 domain-containing protein n=1 Tax=Sinisalibacter lacisalsi TaxID=1526570 RepID=A0ABQ1QEH4_9RHOB|nr:hypothetical protein GCM10011358_03930 [Sinisalibacter lacisalsi]